MSPLVRDLVLSLYMIRRMLTVMALMDGAAAEVMIKSEHMIVWVQTVLNLRTASLDGAGVQAGILPSGDTPGEMASGQPETGVTAVMAMREGQAEARLGVLPPLALGPRVAWIQMAKRELPSLTGGSHKAWAPKTGHPEMETVGVVHRRRWWCRPSPARLSPEKNLGRPLAPIFDRSQRGDG